VAPVVLAIAVLSGAVVRTGSHFGSKAGPWGLRARRVWFAAGVLVLGAILCLIWAGSTTEGRDQEYFLAAAVILSLAVVATAPALALAYFSGPRWVPLSMVELALLVFLLVERLWGEAALVTLVAYAALIAVGIYKGLKALLERRSKLHIGKWVAYIIGGLLAVLWESVLQLISPIGLIVAGLAWLVARLTRMARMKRGSALTGRNTSGPDRDARAVRRRP
jgi:hypothetical protein